MFGLLHEYLIENRQLFLEDIGLLEIKNQPARYDVVNQQMMPPTNQLSFSTAEADSPLQQLAGFMARQLNINEEAAYNIYQAFCKKLRHDIDVNRLVYWERLGAFQKNDNGKVDFVATTELNDYREPVSAPRVIREGLAHTLTVGETETTSTAMKELLDAAPEAETDHWWIGSLVVGVAAVILIVLKKMGYL